MEFLLSVPKPCNQSWDSMNPIGSGRHCASCDKAVTDFSKFSDEQLKYYFLNSNSTVCGRLRSDQLNRTYFTNGNSCKTSMLKGLLKAVFLFGVADLHGSVWNRINTPLPVAEQSKFFSNKYINSYQPKDTIKFVYGKILDDSTKESIAANVSFKGRGYGVTTDEIGCFRLAFPDSLLNRDIVLIIESLGYDSKEILIPFEKLSNPLYITLIPNEGFLIGEICITSTKRAWWKRLFAKKH